MLGTEGGTTTLAEGGSSVLLPALGSPSGLSECSGARESLRRRSGLSDMMLPSDARRNAPKARRVIGNRSSWSQEWQWTLGGRQDSLLSPQATGMGFPTSSCI